MKNEILVAGADSSRGESEAGWRPRTAPAEAGAAPVAPERAARG